MANDTFNFPTWNTRDLGPGNPRGTLGMNWEVGPGSNLANTQPFSTTITSIFSIFIRTGWTALDGAVQGLFSIGKRSESSPSMYYSLNDSATNPALRIIGWDRDASTTRYSIKLGDEDGVSWLQADKWYQFGVSMDSSGISYCVNGEPSPTISTTTNAPGALNLDSLNPRIWFGSTAANSGDDHTHTVTTGYPTVVLGAAAHYTGKLDFSSATVRDRIWDSNGDFKNPGENGSLWFGDAYGSVIPEYYFPMGCPMFQKGSDTQVWASYGGGTNNSVCMPGGLKKQYT